MRGAGCRAHSDLLPAFDARKISWVVFIDELAEGEMGEEGGADRFWRWTFRETLAGPLARVRFLGSTV